MGAVTYCLEGRGEAKQGASAMQVRAAQGQGKGRAKAGQALLHGRGWASWTPHQCCRQTARQADSLTERTHSPKSPPAPFSRPAPCPSQPFHAADFLNSRHPASQTARDPQPSSEPPHLHRLPHQRVVNDSHARRSKQGANGPAGRGQAWRHGADSMISQGGQLAVQPAPEPV